jgi:hypothetical protein
MRVGVEIHFCIFELNTFFVEYIKQDTLYRLLLYAILFEKWDAYQSSRAATVRVECRRHWVRDRGTPPGSWRKAHVRPDKVAEAWRRVGTEPPSRRSTDPTARSSTGTGLK